MSTYASILAGSQFLTLSVATVYCVYYILVRLLMEIKIENYKLVIKQIIHSLHSYSNGLRF